MCSLQDEYETFRRCYWADADPKQCGCRGSGYALSDLDTWHKCPIHHVAGQHHPEDECDCGACPCAHYNAAAAPLPPPAPVQDFGDDDIPF